MIIEKTLTENSKYDVQLDNFAAEGELTVTITLNEYRDLLRDSVKNKMHEEKLSWFEQYDRANKAEQRVKELETEVGTLYKRLSEMKDSDESEEEK